MGRVHDNSGGLGAVLSCSLKGCSTADVGPPQTDPRSPHKPFHSTLQGSAKRHVASTTMKRRPLQGRAVAWRRNPGAALRLPPATLGQAFGLPSRSPIGSRTLSGPGVLAMLAATGFLLLSGCASSGPKADLAYYPDGPGTARVVHLKSFNRLSDLVAAKPTLAEFLRGDTISAWVGTPAGIDYRDGHLYICDTELGVVHDWNLATGRATRVGSVGEVHLETPVDVAVGAQGDLFVADTGLNAALRINAAGTTAQAMKLEDPEAFRPSSVAVRGSTLYVANIAAHTVELFDAASGAHLGKVGSPGGDPGQLYFPMGVAVDGQELLVSEMIAARVQVFDDGGNSLRTFGQPGDRYGDMGKPRHLAVGPDHTAIVADADFARVHLFNAQGQLLLLVGGASGEIGATPMPVGVTVARELPPNITGLVPDGFEADYFFFVSNSVGSRRINLFAVGRTR